MAGAQNDDEVPATKRAWYFYFFLLFRHYCFYRVPKAAQEFLSLPLNCKQKNAKLTASCVKLANWGKLKRKRGAKRCHCFRVPLGKLILYSNCWGYDKNLPSARAFHSALNQGLLIICQQKCCYWLFSCSFLISFLLYHNHFRLRIYICNKSTPAAALNSF